MKKMKFNLSLVFNLLFPLLSAFAISMSLPNFKSYYDNLKVLIRVPQIVFPIVWTILYVLMGYLGYLLSENDDTKGEKIYYLQLILNLMWTPIFFGLKNNWLSLIVIFLLLGLLIYFYLYLRKNSAKMSYFLLPYIIWILFATFLNLSILILN